MGRAIAYLPDDETAGDESAKHTEPEVDCGDEYEAQEPCNERTRTHPDEESKKRTKRRSFIGEQIQKECVTGQEHEQDECKPQTDRHDKIPGE